MAAGGDGIVFVNKLVSIIDQILIRRNGDKGFPSIGDERRWLHRVSIQSYEKRRLDRVLSNGLLRNAQERFKVIAVFRGPGDSAWGEVGYRGRATR